MFCIITVIYKMITDKIPKVLPQKSKKFNSHKYFHGNSCFAALCCEVVFLHIQKNLLGHFSKMDKVRACPKIKHAHISLYACFWWEPNLWDYSIQHQYYVTPFLISNAQIEI